ncbi:ATP-binding protein [Sutcliffiella sp. BMC8]|uniref:ATP-binding protein n=1 Tax=Sutcliffiella sp. BMC8 TaxID=3073243 RepID=UPI0030CEE899
MKSNKSKYLQHFIFLYSILGIYLLYVAVSTPFISMEIREEGGHWVVDDPLYNDWAKSHNIEPGDIILGIDNKSIEESSTMKVDQSIRAANNLTLLKPGGGVNSVEVSHMDLPEQLIMHSLLPSLYFILSLGLAWYLFVKQHQNRLNTLLILFLLSVSLAYISGGASSRLDTIGLYVNGTFLVLCLIFLLHFLKEYFAYLKMEWVFVKNITVLYALPFIILLFSVMTSFNSYFFHLTSDIILSFFLILSLSIFFVLLRGYFKSKSPKLLFILWGLILPILPFILLYALPEILTEQHILSADISAFSLLFIPFSFIYIQLADRLFDIQYHMTRFRYYSMLSLGTGVVMTAGIYYFWGSDRLTFMDTSRIYVFLVILLIAVFYLKEQIDFRQRKILFSTNGDYIHGLYLSIHDLGQARNQQELFLKYERKVVEKLEVSSLDLTVFPADKNSDGYNQLALGEITRTGKKYQMLLHETATEKIVLTIGNGLQTVSLRKEELLWLELLSLYFHSFYGNLKLVEELVEELQLMKSANSHRLPWFDKLLWQILEKEKAILAQELHDTVLQEQLHLARELDLLVTSPMEVYTEKIITIREQLLDASMDLREYCEHLSPPLLDTFGLQAALKKFIQKIKMRADFMLDDHLDIPQLKDPMLYLMIYRLIQELLNNAIKHAKASEVELRLHSVGETGFELIYRDNGAGCEPSEVFESTASMGISGMRERVRAFNGEMDMDSAPGQGMRIKIRMIESSDTSD